MRLDSLLAIDLAGTPKNRSGLAYFKGRNIITVSLYSDEEILDVALSERFKVIGIDAPLSLPKGRVSLEEKGPHFRECDLLLRKRGYRFFPLTLGGMRKLTDRGISLKNILEKEGKTVYEIFPGASLDALGIKRKSSEEVKSFVKELSFRENITNLDESDAVIGLLTLYFLFKGQSEFLKGRDGSILVIKPQQKFKNSNTNRKTNK